MMPGFGQAADMSKNNLEQMSNPMFLIQMVAQQQQYIQILLAKQKELTQQLQSAGMPVSQVPQAPPMQQPAYQPKKAPKPPSTHMGLPPGY